MIHLGDITKISGYTAPIVDVVVGGSPCQDLSVAGKRAGLDGERSGLFMEQLRIIKEMRENDKRNGTTHDIRPRYMVWENVPGAFSSNKAEDFRIVLEETAKVCDKDAVIPMPDKGKWTTAGCIMGDGWSIAWRVLDAQFYGVPQRRRRIALVADFGGQSAPEILFVRKSVSRDTEQSQPKRKETPTDATRSIGADDKKFLLLDDQGGQQISIRTDGKAPTLRAEAHGNVPCPVYSVENHPADSRVDIDESGKVQTLTSRMGTGGGNVPMVMECFSKSKRAQSNTDYETWKESDVANTLNAFDVGDKRTTECVVALDRASFNQGKNARYDFEISNKGINSPIVAKGPSAVAYGFDQGATRDVGKLFLEEQSKTITNGTCPGHHNGVCIAAVDCRNCTENSDTNGTLQSHMSGGSSLNLNNVVRVKYIVRRLTPLECERLQGYPDGWTDIGEWTDSKGKVHKTSDASRYKALGNSIALPPWKWVLKRLCACYERDATMASLFDGIGGFPKIWEDINGKGSCLWASEIESFCVAVTERRFNNE